MWFLRYIPQELDRNSDMNRNGRKYKKSKKSSGKKTTRKNKKKPSKSKQKNFTRRIKSVFGL